MTDHPGGGPIRLIRTGLYLVVGPRDDFAFHDGSAVLVELGEEGEGVGPHQLPHQGQRQGLVPVLDVRACKTGVGQGLRFLMINLLLQLPILFLSPSCPWFFYTSCLPSIPTRTKLSFFPSSTA